jgi:HK97 family phage portal protein
LIPPNQTTPRRTSVPIKVQRVRKGDTQELPGHELELLLEKPSPFESGFDLSEGLTSFLELAGNGYWLAEGGENFRPPTELHNLKPWRMSPIPSKERLVSGWVHNVEGREQTFEWERIVHFKYFSPVHDILGQGSIQPASQAAISDLYAQTFNKRFFQNGAQLHGVLTTPQQVGKDTADRIAREFNLKHQGAANAWKWRVLTHGLEAKGLTPTHVEMAFPELRRMSREEILVAIGVPPVMVGLLDGATYANAQEQRRAFWLNTIIPKLSKQKSTINRALTPRWGQDLQAFHDLTDIDALQEQVDAIVKQVTELQKAGDLTANEAREWLTTRRMPQLEPIEDPHGDTLYLPINLIPTEEEFSTEEEVEESSPPPPEETPPEEDEDQEDQEREVRRSVQRLLPVARLKRKRPKETNGDRPPTDQVVKLLRSLEDQTATLVAENRGELIRVARWKTFESQRRQFDRMFRKTARTMFKAQEAAILAVMDEILKAPKAKADIGGGDTLPAPVARVLEQLTRANHEAFQKTYAATVESAGTAALVDIGVESVEFSMVTAETVHFVESQGAELVRGVNETTKKKLAKTLTEGLANGENNLQMSDRVRGVMNKAKRYRANAIARTESVKSFNYGTVQGYVQSGVVEEKEWLTARDVAVRDGVETEFDHASHDGDRVPPQSNFTISGESLAYPGDSAGSAGNVINCRCTVLPVVTQTVPTE